MDLLSKGPGLLFRVGIFSNVQALASLSVVYCNHLASGDRLLAIGNPSHDAMEQIRFKLHGIPLHSLAMLQKDGTWAQVPWEVRQDGSCVIPEALPPMEFAHLLIQ